MFGHNRPSFHKLLACDVLCGTPHPCAAQPFVETAAMRCPAYQLLKILQIFVKTKHKKMGKEQNFLKKIGKTRKLGKKRKDK